MQPLMLSVSDAARAIGIGKTHLYKLIGEGQLITVKLGRRTLITTASINALVGLQQEAN